MKLSFLTAISTVDGRYGNTLTALRAIFSEFGLLKFRVQIEIRWLQKLASCNVIQEIPPFTIRENQYLEDLIVSFNLKDARRIKTIERTTKHDVKAVEYFLKEKMSMLPSLLDIVEFVHFACTSEDINNLSYALMLSKVRKNTLLPIWKKIIGSIYTLAKRYRDIALLSHTHGQPATPSTFGKEMANFVYRMRRQYHQLKKIKILGKMNGTVGNYNAHIIAYPGIDWLRLSEEFVSGLGISWNPYTTQIEPHDYIAEIFSCVVRFNTILLNFNRDIWGYIAINYLKQRASFNEIGSSIMPHKINPIDFENSEGNLGLSNAVLNHLSEKLPISRWQRDLSDSTVLRNLGVGIGYALVAYQSTLKGINRLEINSLVLKEALSKAWEVLAEPIQTVMRRYKIKKPYEQLKALTRGKAFNSEDMKNFINNLPIPDFEKKRLNKLTPYNYTGRAAKMVDELRK